MDLKDIFKRPPPPPLLSVSGAQQKKRKADLDGSEPYQEQEQQRPAPVDHMEFMRPGNEDESEEREPLTEKERIKHIVDRMGEDGTGPLTQKAVRKIVSSLDKAFQNNQELRLKYAHYPQKFMESEIELDGEIKKLLQVAAAPEHFPVLLEMNVIPTILSLLSHANADIAIDTIELIQELTDEDVIPEDRRAIPQAQSGMEAFINALVENQIFELLVNIMERLDEQGNQDDIRGVFASLGIIENLVAFDTKLAEYVSQNTVILHWLIDRVSAGRPFDSNKQYASEILAILLQDSPYNRKMLLEEGRLEELMKSLAVFRKRDPANADEQEMMENLFDCLCSAVIENDIREAFIKAEGIELMCLMLKDKLLSRIRALKVLAFSMSATEGGAERSSALACEAFVQNSGMKYLSAALMKKHSKRLKKEYPSSFSDAEENEYSVEILSALFRHLNANPPAFLIFRVLTKLKEENYEKIDRLIELFEDYLPRLAKCNAEIKREQESLEEAGEEIADPSLEAEWYLRRSDAGLSIMQNISQILGHLLVTYAADYPDLKNHVEALMRQKSRSVAELVDLLEEYMDNLPEDIVIQTGEKVRLLRILVALNEMLAEE